MTAKVRLKKLGTLIPRLLLETPQLLQIQDGQAQRQEHPPSPLLPVTLEDHLGQELQDSSHFTLVLGHQGSTQDLRQLLVDSPPVLGSQDSIHLELRGSSPPVLEPLGSSRGSIHPKELQDNYLVAQSPIQLDRFLLAQELLLGRTPVFLSLEVGKGCMARAVLVPSLLLTLLHFLHSLLEVFHPYPVDHGAHPQVEVSLLPQARLVQAQGRWVRTEARPLLEACW